MIAGIVAYALSFEVNEAPVNADLYQRSGAALEALFPSPGTTVRPPSAEAGAGSYAVLTAHMTQELAPPSAGVFATLGPAYEKNFAGQVIDITVRARAGQVNPSPKMLVNYITPGVGQTGWRAFDLGEDFTDYSLEFSPLKSPEVTNHYLGIWPDTEGQGRTVEVESVTVERRRQEP
jgi:hypothetical protein